MRARVAWLVAVAALGAGAARAEAPGYPAAVAAFDQELTLAERLKLQVRLIAGGWTNGVPTDRLSPNTFEAIKAYQSSIGARPTGRFTLAVATRLRDDTQATMAEWGFAWVEHPSRPLRVWAPLGLLGEATPTRYGVHYEDGGGRVEFDLLSYPLSDIRATYEDSLRDWRRRGVKVWYSPFHDKEEPSWWVASTTTPDGHDHYYRYVQDGDAVTGFALEWNNAAGPVHGDRIAVIVSGSMFATAADRFFPDPPDVGPRYEQQAAVPVAPPPKPEAKPPAEKGGGSSGTGFFVSAGGDMVTNAHVVKDCRAITVKGRGGTARAASLRALDEHNDLALLRVSGPAPARVAVLRAGVRLGEPVEAFGFPYTGLLSSTGNFTTGGVTALSGIGDDTGLLQISAPVQSGNSGGPLMDAAGAVVGVVTSKLNAIRVLAAADDLPQNVNFAIKASRVAEFLGANGVGVATVGAGAAALAPADVAEQAQAMSGFVVCGR